MEDGLREMEKAVVAERKIERLCDLVGCTEAGAAWMKQALDPFNDEERTNVGYPDLETGKSIIQKIPFGVSYTVGASAEDVNIFMDSWDTREFLYENTRALSNGQSISGNFSADSASGVGTIDSRGGLCLRKGVTGTTLDQSTSINLGGALTPAALNPSYLANCGARIVAKAFEVVNTTPQLTVGGSVRCYRVTGETPYSSNDVVNARNASNYAISTSFSEKVLQPVPTTIQEVELFGGYTFWNAKDGCMVVAVSAAETNEIQAQGSTVVQDGVSIQNPSKIWYNVNGNGTTLLPTRSATTLQLASPFLLCGAYFSGLPPGSTLDIRGVYYLERFLTKDQTDLILLANPSPSFDAVALELYSRSAMKLPCGTRVKNNADGDWIKTVADVLGVFGVPGMPLVRGAVDAFYGAKNIYDNWGQSDERTETMRKTLKSVGVKPGKNQRVANRNKKRANKGKNSINTKQFIGPLRPGESRKQVQKANKSLRKGMASGQ